MRTAAIYAYSPDTNSGMAVYANGQILHADLDETFTLARCARLASIAAEHDPRTITTISVEDFEKNKKYIYHIENNRLTIFKDGAPVYENWNGKICTDHGALADSIL